MIEPVPEAIPPSTIPPAEAPEAYKAKKADEEKKFAHQLEQIIIKEQKEYGKTRKIEEERKEAERQAKKERKRNKEEKKEVDKEDNKGRFLDVKI